MPAAEHGEWLAGNAGGAWRVGDTVRRRTGPWTPAVHALLGHLRPRLAGVPAVLGFDDSGREILSYLPGRVVDIHAELLTEAQLISVGRWTRSFHDAVAGFTHPGPWRFPATRNPVLVAHNDIGTYNICFDGDEVAGVFDWDLAAPSNPLQELAYIAWHCVPLWQDIGPGRAAANLTLLAAGYGNIQAADVLRAVPRRMQFMLDWIPAAAAAGDEGMTRLMANGEPGQSLRYLAGLRQRLPAIDQALGR
ncbi:MAG TPA: phosphotransferase [Streptosporangiaceae bacterium]|nr:phosphotransferase [Streptosporangiaceae bacterium]